MERLESPVPADIPYVVNTGEKLVNETFGPNNIRRRRTGTQELRRVDIHNGRLHPGRFSLDGTGFVLVEHQTAVADFFDPGQIKSVYYPEVERLIGETSGASRVVIFDHTLRSGDEGEREARLIREPVLSAHNDYTEWSGPQRVRDLLPDEAGDLLKHRMAVIQVWRPVRDPVLATPLAICDARSIGPKDLIAADRRYEDRVGEIYQVAYNPQHRWFYFPRMRRDEAIVFKCYDSETDGRARFTAHTAFEDPTAPPDAPPRESIEMRTIAFWGPPG